MGERRGREPLAPAGLGNVGLDDGGEVGFGDVRAAREPFEAVAAGESARGEARIGDLEEARPALERAAQRARSRGEEWDRMALAHRLAQLEWEMGNWPLAEQHRQAAYDAVVDLLESDLPGRISAHRRRRRP